MKILYVTPFYAPAYGFGGPVSVAHTIATLMAQHNSVSVFTTDALDATERVDSLEEVIDGVKVFRFRNMSPKLAKNFNLYTPRKFATYLRAHITEYQVVHLHAFFTYQNVYTCSQCRKHKIPFVLHLHEAPAPLPILGKVKIKQIFNALWGKRVLKEAAMILVVSGREKELLVDYMPELAKKVEIVPNLLPENLPAPQGKRADYNLSDDQKVVLSLSRLSRLKGIDHLIRAFHQLVQKDESFQLLIAGPDEAGTGQELIALTQELHLEKNVRFLGIVNAEERATLFSIADVYALFSAYESFSISTLESLYYHTPACLSSNVGVAPDIAPYHCSITIEDTADEAAAAQAIQETYENREILSKGCAKALAQFSANGLENRLTKLYTLVSSNS